MTVVVVAGALGLAELYLSARSANRGLLILGIATTAFALALVPAWWTSRRGDNDRAVFFACIAIFAIQATYLVVYPQAYAALAIASVVVVALALSFVHGRKLFGLMVAAWSVAVAAVVIGVLGESRYAIPEGAANVVLLGSGLAAVTVGMVLLWQFARDMTEALDESKTANRELSRAHKQLHEQEQAKTRFINVAAHELNTPLTPVMLQLHLLRAGKHAMQDPKQERMVQLLERNLERMKGLVHEMLDVARLQAGRLALRVEVFDLNDALRAAVDDFTAVAKSRQVDLTLQVPGPLPVTTDRRRVEQVLSNLVSNAVRLTPARGSVTVTASADPEGTVVHVRDTGVGLTREQIDHLFQPFSRVHDEATAGTGSGLGLYICQGLMHEMGGRIWVTSAGPGKGSEFSLLLPPRPPQQSEPHATQALTTS